MSFTYPPVSFTVGQVGDKSAFCYGSPNASVYRSFLLKSFLLRKILQGTPESKVKVLPFNNKRNSLAFSPKPHTCPSLYPV